MVLDRAVAAWVRRRAAAEVDRGLVRVLEGGESVYDVAREITDRL